MTDYTAGGQGPPRYLFLTGPSGYRRRWAMTQGDHGLHGEVRVRRGVRVPGAISGPDTGRKVAGMADYGFPWRFRSAYTQTLSAASGTATRTRHEGDGAGAHQGPGVWRDG
jgi:hypothetical protein